MTSTEERTPPLTGWWFVDFYRSSVGKKWVMAVTGILLLAYVFAHMVGNLKIFLGAAELDHYAEFLRSLGEPIVPHGTALWIMRTGLLVAFILHLHSAYALTIVNQRARPEPYRSTRDYIAVGYASRTMRVSGIIVLLFILWHLADLTWGLAFANPDFIAGQAYKNTTASLARVPVATLYIVANLLLGMHIYHGTWSMFQSLGVANPRFNQWRRWIAQGFTAIIVIGNLSIPIAVLAGVV